MLTESFVASVLKSREALAVQKDSGIFIHDYQPLPSHKSTFERSSTGPNCLAATKSHIFAAQSDRSAVLVYTVGRKNPDLVPFPERISSLALIGGTDEASILALGMGEGRVILWELCTGRQVSTSRAHLEAISCLVVDASRNFLLTGSPDSRIHVWSIPALLSYSLSSSHGSNQSSSNAPIQSLSSHRAAITSLITGHSHTGTDIAISGSRDKTCRIWDYRTGTLLHTFILFSTPLCLALDPADRAFYAGFEDGSIQPVGLYKRSSFTNPIQNAELSATPTQPPAKDRWFPDSASSTLALAVSYDGTSILSGHEDGKIHEWDTAQGRVIVNAAFTLFAPVTNIIMLSPTGFPVAHKSRTTMSGIVKPWHGEVLNGDASGNGGDMANEKYTFMAQFTSPLPTSRFFRRKEESLMSDFDAALTDDSFPKSYLEDSIILFNSQTLNDGSIPAGDRLHEEVSMLKAQLAHSRMMQLHHAETSINLREEVFRLQEERTMKQRAKRIRRIKRAKADEVMRKRVMGEKVSEADDNDGQVEDEGQASSTTDELTDSE